MTHSLCHRPAWPATALALLLVATAMSPPAEAQLDTAATELTLRAAVARALEYHPQALAAQAGVDAATAAVGETRAEYFPHVAVEASATRHQEPMIVAPLHGLDFTNPPEFNRTLYRGSATVGFTLFDGGARSARVHGARAEATAAESLRASTEATLIAEVTRVYLQVVTARDILVAHHRRIAALEAEQTRVDRLLREGTAARVELLRADAAMAQADAELIAASATLDVAEHGLARLIGSGPEEVRETRLVPVTLHDSLHIADVQALRIRAESANPELQQARSKLEAARSVNRVAGSAWLPRLSLFGGYLGFGSAAGNFAAEWQAGAQISYPLFTGGARSSGVARANALAEVALQEVRRTELTVQNGVDRAVSAVRESRARVTAVEQAVAHLAEVARIEQLALDAGAGTQTDYLRAEAELLQARATLIEVRNAEIVARIELARIVGDLSPDWIDRAVENMP